MEPTAPLVEMCRKLVAAERAAIVAYIRRRPFLTVPEIIDAIDAGAHLRGDFHPPKETQWQTESTPSSRR